MHAPKVQYQNRQWKGNHFHQRTKEKCRCLKLILFVSGASNPLFYLNPDQVGKNQITSQYLHTGLASSCGQHISLFELIIFDSSWLEGKTEHCKPEENSVTKWQQNWEQNGKNQKKPFKARTKTAFLSVLEKWGWDSSSIFSTREAGLCASQPVTWQQVQ